MRNRSVLGDCHKPASFSAWICSWSRNGRRLLSGSADWSVIVWDVLASEPSAIIHFTAPIVSVSMHPRYVACIAISPASQTSSNDDCSCSGDAFVASLVGASPVLHDLNSTSQNSLDQFMRCAHDSDDTSKSEEFLQQPLPQLVVAAFNHDGSQVRFVRSVYCWLIEVSLFLISGFVPNSLVRFIPAMRRPKFTSSTLS
jgi:WD40 repeat protein